MSKDTLTWVLKYVKNYKAYVFETDCKLDLLKVKEAKLNL
jgi:hypothetical protein